MGWIVHGLCWALSYLVMCACVGHGQCLALARFRISWVIQGLVWLRVGLSMVWAGHRLGMVLTCAGNGLCMPFAGHYIVWEVMGRAMCVLAWDGWAWSGLSMAWTFLSMGWAFSGLGMG
jgi:hypothetical protein